MSESTAINRWSEMTPRERDYAVAVAMGNEIKTAADLLDGVPIGVRHYTTDIAAAWRVVEYLQRRGMSVEIYNGGNRGKHYGGCSVKVLDFASNQKWEGVSIDSAPEAICLAALRALGGVDGS